MKSNQGRGMCNVLASKKLQYGRQWKMVENTGKFRKKRKELNGKLWKLPEVSMEEKETSGGFLECLDL